MGETMGEEEIQWTHMSMAPVSTQRTALRHTGNHKSGFYVRFILQ